MTNRIRQLRKSTNPIELESTMPCFSADDFEWIVPQEIRDLKRFGGEGVFILPVSKYGLHELMYSSQFIIVISPAIVR
jgi:hypothetical protein